MSRVLARTSMISEEAMLNAATRMMMHSTTNIAMRSTSSASNSAEFICRQSTMMPLPWTSGWSGASVSPTRSGSSTWTSTMPTWSPSSSRVCASCIGMMTNALSYSKMPTSKIAPTV